MDTTDDGSLLPCDLVSLSGTLKVCNTELVLLGANAPRAFVDSLTQGEALFCTTECAFPFFARLTLPTHWCMLGYVHYTGDGSWCHGMPLSTDTAFVVLPEGRSELKFSTGTRLTLVLLPLTQLQERITRLDDPCQMQAPPRLHPLFNVSGTQKGIALQQLYRQVRRQIIAGPLLHDAIKSAGDAEIDTGALIDMHVTANLAATPEERPVCSRSQRKHYLIVQRAEQYMRVNLREDIYVEQLCNAAGVSERALRYAFDDLMGISPKRFLSMLRLCTACRSLTLSDASRRSVKSVALSCGLWDLSRFADSYRRVFGELPSDTLTRPPIDDDSIAMSGPMSGPMSG